MNVVFSSGLQMKHQRINEGHCVSCVFLSYWWNCLMNWIFHYCMSHVSIYIWFNSKTNTIFCPNTLLKFLSCPDWTIEVLWLVFQHVSARSLHSASEQRHVVPYNKGKHHKKICLVYLRFINGLLYWVFECILFKIHFLYWWIL